MLSTLNLIVHQGAARTGILGGELLWYFGHASTAAFGRSRARHPAVFQNVYHDSEKRFVRSLKEIPQYTITDPEPSDISSLSINTISVIGEERRT